MCNFEMCDSFFYTNYTFFDVHENEADSETIENVIMK